MQTFLPVNVGQCSHSTDSKRCNDWFDFKIPQGNELLEKGAAFAFASDGVHPKDVLASVQTVVRSFLLDYFSTPKAWTAEESMQRVVRAMNGWMNAQNQYAKEGEVVAHCEFCGLVFHAGKAYIIRVGNTPIFIYRKADNQLTAITPCADRPLGESFLCLSDVMSSSLQSGDIIVISNRHLASLISTEDLLIHLQKRGDDLNHTAYAIVEQADKTSRLHVNSVGLIEIR
jgi:uncharacterized C2H2 Zn-finger protein